MSRDVLRITLLQAALAAGAISVAIVGRLPWPITVALVAAGAQAVQVARRRQVTLLGRVVGWACALVVLVSLLLSNGGAYLRDGFYALPLWLAAVVVLLAVRGIASESASRRWRWIGMAWAFLGGGLWITAAYLQNQRQAFYFGLAVNAGLLVLCKLGCRLAPLAVLTMNTLILLLVGLPLADLTARFHHRQLSRPDPEQKSFSYANARRDPQAFRSWWNYFWGEWTKVERTIQMPDPDAVLPFRLRPDSRAQLVQSEIYINHRGFRGPEIPEVKGPAYRIVALGESTTFGFTLAAADQPWPELLEQLIRARLKPSRPVEVINAGVPSFDLRHNLHRLPSEILPLKPDLIISYHGFNGFHFIAKSLPVPYARNPPVYIPRPLKLLADCEYRLRVACFLRRQTASLRRSPPTFYNPLNTEYAQAYRDLIQIARTNGIQLVLANYSMAVNAQSDPQIIEFYRKESPAVYFQIQANEVHSTIVQELAAQHPEVRYVDTHPGLDGEHDEFIDLVRFTQEGRRRLAETIFAGIEPVLREGLSQTGSPNVK